MELLQIIEDRLQILFNLFDNEIPSDIKDSIIGITHNFIKETNLKDLNTEFTELFINELSKFIFEYKNHFESYIILIDEFINYFLIVIIMTPEFNDYEIEEEFMGELIFDIIEKTVGIT